MGAVKSKLSRTMSRSGSRKGKEKTEEKKKSFKEEKRSSRKSRLPESPSARRTVDPRLPFGNYRQVFGVRNAWKAISRSLEECARENLIRFFKENPGYIQRFGDIKHLKNEEEMRDNDDFDIIAVDMYQLFDDVIANLENVDKALMDIRMASRSTWFTRRMLKAFESSFIETIRMHLGVERFPETTENNMRILYGFVRDELGSYLTEVEVNDTFTTVETSADTNTAVPIPDDANSGVDTGEKLEDAKDNSEPDNSGLDKTSDPGDTEKRNSIYDNDVVETAPEINTETTETNHIKISNC